jgi:HPt (histidine-containing phosphotransfer) domain-containing protein
MLKRFGGDEDLIRIVLDSFLEESPELVDKLRGAIDMGDMEAIESYSHALKGSSANVNAWFLNKIAIDIEKSAKHNEFSKLPALLLSLEHEFVKFTKEISP